MRPYAWLIGLTAVGALLRFATLGTQSFWEDELYTVWLVRMGFTDMITTIPASESTPPLYYVLAWLWSGIFGSTEAGIRSLSAIFGTTAIPVAYAIGSTLASRRAGMVTALLVAVNPFLVWYSQEARAYALVVPLAALSFLFFVRTLMAKRRSDLIWWALFSALACATHYFAFFLVFIEAIWLLLRVPKRKRVALAAVVPALTLAALAPLATYQRAQGHAEAVGADPLIVRVVGVAKAFLVGYQLPWELMLTLIAGALIAVAFVLMITRVRGHARDGALVAIGIATATVASPIALAAVGLDYVSARNLLPALIPGIAGAAIGFAGTRLGIMSAAALSILFSAIVFATVADDRYQRLDWRGAARAVGTMGSDEVLVVTPFMRQDLWIYVRPLREVRSPSVAVREINVVALATAGRFAAGVPTPPRPRPPSPPPGFQLVEKRYEETYSVLRYRAPQMRRVSRTRLSSLRLDPHEDASLLIPRTTAGPRT